MMRRPRAARIQEHGHLDRKVVYVGRNKKFFWKEIPVNALPLAYRTVSDDKLGTVLMVATPASGERPCGHCDQQFLVHAARAAANAASPAVGQFHFLCGCYLCASCSRPDKQSFCTGHAPFLEQRAKSEIRSMSGSVVKMSDKPAEAAKNDPEMMVEGAEKRAARKAVKKAADEEKEPAAVAVPPAPADGADAGAPHDDRRDFLRLAQEVSEKVRAKLPHQPMLS